MDFAQGIAGFGGKQIDVIVAVNGVGGCVVVGQRPAVFVKNRPDGIAKVGKVCCVVGVDQGKKRTGVQALAAGKIVVVFKLMTRAGTVIMHESVMADIRNFALRILIVLLEQLVDHETVTRIGTDGFPERGRLDLFQIHANYLPFRARAHIVWDHYNTGAANLQARAGKQRQSARRMPQTVQANGYKKRKPSARLCFLSVR